MLDRGAKIEVSEDKEMFLGEASGEVTFVERDQAVAKNIDAKLLAGDIGLLIFGASHHIGAHLPKDIELRMVITDEDLKAFDEETNS